MLPLLLQHRWYEIDVWVATVDRGWWKRRVVLAGSINAEIKYDPAGHGERVFINGKLMLRRVHIANVKPLRHSV